MRHTRRTLLARAASLVAASSCLFDAGAFGDTVTYKYDALGRVTQAIYSSGTSVFYTYDAAGNRTLVVRTNGSGFNATYQLTGGGPVNLRSVANSLGYDGAQNATMTFQVLSGVTIQGSSSGGIAVDTGTWPTGSYSIVLTLAVLSGGKIYGGGGQGGSAPSGNGGAGGDAVYARAPMTVTVASGAEIKCGGPGGGVGGGWNQFAKDPDTGLWVLISSYLGGGGGGGAPNGLGGTGFSNGANGTLSAGGAHGNGQTGLFGSRACGNGANGATITGTSSAGVASTGTEGIVGGVSKWTKTAPGAGSVPGYAIRKNGNTVTVTNSGTITGTVG
jgi:YD repeat-containing protein